MQPVVVLPLHKARGEHPGKGRECDDENAACDQRAGRQKAGGLIGPLLSPAISWLRSWYVDRPASWHAHGAGHREKRDPASDVPQDAAAIANHVDGRHASLPSVRS